MGDVSSSSSADGGAAGAGAAGAGLAPRLAPAANPPPPGLTPNSLAVWTEISGGAHSVLRIDEFGRVDDGNRSVLEVVAPYDLCSSSSDLSSEDDGMGVSSSDASLS